MNPPNYPKYTMPDGLLSSSPTPNYNEVSYTAQLLALLEVSKDSSAVAKHNHWLYYKALLQCEPNSNGLWSQISNGKIDCKIDDHISVASTTDTAAQRILAQGRKNWGFFSFANPFNGSKNPLKWNWPRFLWRNVGFWVHTRYKAGENPGWFHRFAWSFSVWLASGKPVTQQDTYFQTHLMIMTYNASKYHNWLCNLAVKYWWKKKPQPMREFVKTYLTLSYYEDHPLYFWWDDYGAPKTKPKS